MNGSFVRREWGAVTFVLTVVVGLVAVLTAFLVVPHPTASSGNVPSATPAASSPRLASSPR